MPTSSTPTSSGHLRPSSQRDAQASAAGVDPLQRKCSGRRFFSCLQLIAYSLGLFFFSACTRQPPPPDILSADADRGPFKLTVTATPTHPRVGDTIKLSATVAAPRDHLVLFPDAAAFGDLTVTVAPLTDSIITPDGVRWRQDYFIDPLVGGELTLPPLIARIAQTPAESPTSQPAAAHPTTPQPGGVAALATTPPTGAAPDYKYELRIENLKLTVASALTPTDSVDKPRDITGTLAPPPRPLTPTEWALLAASCIAAVGLAWLVARWIRARLFAPPPPLAPDIAALRALAELAALNWFAAGRIREYYYALSEIVRIYIERKFTLAAPEMTTEEFLRALAHNSRALPYDAAKLRQFLESCDIVKYAAFAPQQADADDALASARAFIHATAAQVGWAVPTSSPPETPLAVGGSA